MARAETLSDISIFVTVVDAGSFTSAADKLELSKSQVSKCVNRLESTLGEPHDAPAEAHRSRNRSVREQQARAGRDR